MNRESPQRYLETAMQWFKLMKGETIVEIGTIRRDDDLHRFYDGWSTSYFVKVASHVWSVDIDVTACELCRNILAEYDNLTVVYEDGLSFIGGFEGKIDLLYLDAMKGNEPDAPEFHLGCYKVARDRGLLHKKSLVLIDDTDLNNGGKGELVIPECIRDGKKLVFQGRQTLLV